MQIESTVVEQLGVARKITISSTSTTLIADSASKDEIDMRVAQVSLVEQRRPWVGSVRHMGTGAAVVSDDQD